MGIWSTLDWDDGYIKKRAHRNW